jgi:SEL1 protein
MCFAALQFLQALLFYLRAAEMGMEFGQSNAAWMLDRGYAHAGPHAVALAAQLYRRSAEQGNVISLLQLGDRYYYGMGVDQDWVRAAAIYYEAYQERSPEAMFDLGFMHQFGAGVPQDLALAVRFYDMCKHTLADAALPVYLAKSWLRVHEAWLWLLPKFPQGVQKYARYLFVLHPARVGGTGAGRGVLTGLMPQSLSLHWESMAWRIGKMTKVVMLQLPWDLLNGEFGDTILLGLLLVVLWVVLKVRRQRQLTGGQGGQQGGQQAGQAWGGLGAQGQPQQQQPQPQEGLQQPQPQQPAPTEQRQERSAAGLAAEQRAAAAAGQGSRDEPASGAVIAPGASSGAAGGGVEASGATPAANALGAVDGGAGGSSTAAQQGGEEREAGAEEVREPQET